MTVPARWLAPLLGLGSACMLLAAAVFEHGYGLAPCIMCLWQRWPHWLVLVLGALAMAFGRSAAGTTLTRPVLGLMATVLLAGAGIAFWHAGVELGILPGPTACGGGVSLAGDTAAVLDNLLAAPVVRCDEVSWSFLGISMAGWNGIISLAMAGLASMGVIRYRATGAQ